MAELDFTGYRSGSVMAGGYPEKARRVDVEIDFSLAGNQTAGATDSLNLLELPAGTVVLAAGIEQVTVGTASNTYAARVGTTAISGTLAGDAAIGTKTAHVDTSGGSPLVLATAADFNLLSASAVRVAGIARAWIVFVEGTGRPRAKVAARDTSTGLA